MTLPSYPVPDFEVPDFDTLYPNAVGDEMYEFFAPYIERWGDPNNDLWIYLHALGMMLKQVHDMVGDGINGEPGWSQILDLMRAKTEWLPWIGQWTGYTVPAQGTDPLDVYDPNQRRMIYCMGAHRRGTVDQLYDAIEAHLNEPATVLIHERTPDPDHIDVFVMASQVKTSQALLTQAALAAKAAGLLLVMNFVVDGTYTQLKANNNLYSGLPPKFISYSDMSLNPGRP